MVAKKGGKSRKRSLKKSKRAPKIVQGVGILSSIAFKGTKLETAFVAGLGSKTLVKRVEEKLGYDATALEDAVKELNFDTNIGLIVTVGGLITWEAASKNPGGSTLPYMSLIGGRAGAGFPLPGSGKFVHAVSLESFNRNPNRVQKLIQKLGGGAKANEICLISNPNSQMAPTETTAWISRTVSADVTPNTVNVRAVYDAAFAAVSALANPPIRGVVVSADPWFTDTAAHLVAAANAWVSATRFICYPTQEYKNHNPAVGSRVLHGPKLEKAYKRLGQNAKTYLGNPKPIPIEEEDEEVTN